MQCRQVLAHLELVGGLVEEMALPFLGEREGEKRKTGERVTRRLRRTAAVRPGANVKVTPGCIRGRPAGAAAGPG